MPRTMTDKENLLSLISIEVLVNHVQIELNIECHLPCIVFRLLDYPAVSIPYFDQWQIEEFHNLKKIYPNVSWRQLLSDQFYELRSANGKFNFKRGKSCLFKTYFQTLYKHLLNVPLFILLIDQINDKNININTSHFIGSCNVKLNELIEILNQSIIKNGNDIPLVEQQTFHCTLFNLMGTKIGTCDIAVRFCHYGTTILTHLPMLDDNSVTKIEKKIPPVIKEQVVETITQPISTDTVVKHIQFVNEKKDVGLQLSRSDLPSSINHSNKSAQTRWTSTKSRTSDYHQSKSRHLRTIEDPSLDDPTIDFYRPPPLYFNSDSDFLQMMTPTTTKVVEEAKENRLSYLASIPIASFDENDHDDTKTNVENEEKKQPKRKIATNVRFNPPSSLSTIVSRTNILPKQQILTKDFLHDFPLLRALVEEALALQQCQYDMPISVQQAMLEERPYSAMQQRQKPGKKSPIRPKSATNTRSIRTKSVIVTRNINNNTRRLYPPPLSSSSSSSKRNQMIVTKNEVRHLVDRLSKPKLNKREHILINQETPSPEPIIITRPRSSKSIPTSTTNTTPKPTLTYGTTRAHRLMTEFSRARRAGFEPQTTSSPKSQSSSKNESTSKSRIPSSSPPMRNNTGTASRLSLLNKVDVDTATIDKTSIKRPSLDIISENINPTIKSASTTSQDVTLKLNQTLTKTISLTPTIIVSQHQQKNDEQKDDLNFSITDITDYFTDGGESSIRPSTRQST